MPFSHKITALLALLSALTTTASMAADNYLLILSEGGRFSKRFPVTLKYTKPGFQLLSEVSYPIALDPVKPIAIQSRQDTTQPLPGRYTVTIANHKQQRQRFSVQLKQEGDAFILRGDRHRLLRLYPDPARPLHSTAQQWLSPFNDDDRSSFARFKARLVDHYGAYRASVKKGHKHAGIDIKGDWRETVFAIAEGEVIFISNWDKTGAVIIRHRLPDGNTLYSKYVHIRDVQVNVGDRVTPQTRLGRLFDRQEFGRSGYKHNHLHLEIRKSYSDKGRASSYSMSLEQLNRYCYNPLKFMQKYLAP